MRITIVGKKLQLAVAGVVASLMLGASALAAPITPGNLVVTRAAGGANGDATAPLSGGGVAAGVWLDEYTPGGSLVQSILVNTTLNATAGSQRALTFSGTANTEGHITLSQDGNYMAFAGYNQTATTAGTNASASNVVERVVGILNLATGAVDTSTAFVDSASQQNVRTAYTTNGTDIWVAGNGGNNVTISSVAVPTNGVHYGQLGVTTGGTTLSTPINRTGLNANSRTINVFNGWMYTSSGNTSSPYATTRGPNRHAAGIPTQDSNITGNTLVSLPGFPTNNSPDDFWFKDDFTVYVADSRTDGNGGIQKWTSDGTTWTMQYAYAGLASGLSTIGGANAGVHGLTGYIDINGNAVLFATSLDGTGANQTKLLTITDTGASATYTTLATSGTNTAFRGIEIAMLPPIPEPGTLSVLAITGLAMLRRRRA